MRLYIVSGNEIQVEFWIGLFFLPASIMPPVLHTHHLCAALTRRTSGKAWESSNKALLFCISREDWKKSMWGHPHYSTTSSSIQVSSSHHSNAMICGNVLLLPLSLSISSHCTSKTTLKRAVLLVQWLEIERDRGSERALLWWEEENWTEEAVVL